MSLEGDLLMPPRGPLKWRWLKEIITRVAQHLKIVSPDGEFTVAETASGLQITQRQDSNPPPSSTAWIVTGVSVNRYQVFGGGISINGGATVQVEDTFVTASAGQIIALKLDYELDAGVADDTPIFTVLISTGDVDITSLSIEAMTQAEFEAAITARPQVRSTGTLCIALAVITGSTIQSLVGTTDFSLSIQHDQFSVSQT